MLLNNIRGYALFFRLIQPIPAAAPAAITAIAAGPVSPTGGLLVAMGVTEPGERPPGRVEIPGRTGRSKTVAWTPGVVPPAPNPSRRQKRSQPSPLSRLPSSQTSAWSRTRSPQRDLEQFNRQRSGSVSLLLFPSSHSSPASMEPFPQKRERNRQSLPQR